MKLPGRSVHSENVRVTCMVQIRKKVVTVDSLWSILAWTGNHEELEEEVAHDGLDYFRMGVR